MGKIILLQCATKLTSSDNERMEHKITQTLLLKCHNIKLNGSIQSNVEDVGIIEMRKVD